MHNFDSGNAGTHSLNKWFSDQGFPDNIITCTGHSTMSANIQKLAVRLTELNPIVRKLKSADEIDGATITYVNAISFLIAFC